MEISNAAKRKLIYIENLISIIMPVYNTEEAALRRAIDSVINQTYEKWELIIIDDGSLPKYGSICDAYSIKDARVKVVHKNNEGVSSARNEGLKICKGQFVSFLDSDDYIDKEYLRYLYEMIISNSADISMCCCNRVKENNKVNESDDCGKILIVNRKDAIENLCYMREQFPGNELTSVWAKLYKKEVLNNCNFDTELVIGEDFFYNFNYLCGSSKIVIGSLKLYTYVINDGSLLHSGFNEKKKKTFNRLKELEKKDYGLYAKPMLSRIINNAILLYLMIPRKQFIKEKKEIKNFIKQKRFLVLKDKNARKKLKIALYLTYFGFNFMRCIYKILKTNN